MIIDIIFVIIIILAAFSGYKRGLVVAVFSLVALIVGLAAAMKLSAVVASYIGKAVKVTDEWLPVISFALVFLLVYLLVRWMARIIERTAQWAMLGWGKQTGRHCILCRFVYNYLQRCTFLYRANRYHKTGNKKQIRYVFFY